MTCLFYHPEQTVVTSPDCFRHGSTFATHNTLVQTDTTVHTLPTTNTHHNRRDGTTPWINQHTFNLLLHTLLQFAQGSWSLNFVDPLAGLCGAWWLSTYYTSIFTVCKLCMVTNSSLYPEHIVEVVWKKEKQKRSGLQKDWHTTEHIQYIRPTSKTSTKTMHALKMTVF